MYTLLILGCSLQSGQPNDTTDDGSISTTSTLTEQGVEVQFVLDVPPGARNVELWFDDGTSVSGDLTPTHTYRNNASYQPSLFWDDDASGGRVTAELLIDEVPLPAEALSLPDVDGDLLVAVNHYGFLPNYTANEPSHTFLYGSQAWAARRTAGSSSSIADLSIDFYGEADGPPTRLTLEDLGDHSGIDLNGEAHQKIPGWLEGDTELYAGGFTMPLLDRTDGPELNFDPFLTNAHFPITEPLDVGLRLDAGGGAHGLHYTLVGNNSTLVLDAPSASGKAVVTVAVEDLEALGAGVVGVYASLYSEIADEGQLVRSYKVGYMPIVLDE